MILEGNLLTETLFLNSSAMQKKLLFSLFGILLSLTACNTPSKQGGYLKIAGFAQGTTYHITYQLSDSVDLQLQIDSILKVFDGSLSSYDSNSVISNINRNEDVIVDEMFTRVFKKSLEVYNESNGIFDITVMPLVNAWGFGPGTREDVNNINIDSLLEFVGMEKVKLQNGKVVKSDPRIQLDVNAIAQGYSVDVVAGFLDSLGSQNYLVEIGGEIRAIGVNPSGNRWRVGIDKPEFGNMIPGAELEAIVELNNKSLATSGNYRKYYEENGVKYTHSIDPKTGYPAKQSLLSATIVSDDCMTADAYATVCMVAGLEKSKEILAEHPELDAYLIFGDEAGIYQLFVTPGMKKMVVEQQ
jgi:thiamine biosynthesis lipoprotein